MSERTEDTAAWVREIVQAFCRTPANSLQNAAGEPAWDDPLVGFSRGDDPLYEHFREYVGPFHWTPWEVFSHAFPGVPAAPKDLTVIVWVLPQTRATKADNRREVKYPAERWARSRIYGEAFNDELRRHVAGALQAAGHEAVAPQLAPGWRTVPSERFVFASTWSERHAAYASGLGTFGLCDGLITPRGKAVRIGTVVARLTVPPTPRPYTDHHAYCLFYSRGTCRKCIDRCPVGAISEQGHDKQLCSAHLSQATAPYVREQYGFAGYGCGLCQTGVPCESGIPQ